ncbi:MAG: hypothetical protein J5I59_08935 [Saprospiraceae bacterium]|nr:hypothetical protein [Saprospiraceae bacterium]
MNKLITYSTLFFIALSLISCKDDIIDTNNQQYSAEINNIVDNVIIATYRKLDNSADTLVRGMIKLKEMKTNDQLEAVREAWRQTRIPWEQSEGFLFGPVDSKGIDPGIDSWPVNVEDLNAVLESNDILTKEYIDLLEGTLKGFHTIEWLIFGETGNKNISEFTDRQFDYLISCTQSLKGSTAQLLHEWNKEGNDFENTVKSAGQAGNNVYPSEKAVLLEFNDGIITIADEVANGKIDEPFTSQNLLFEESRFSANSKNDFANNIRSIQNIYLGGINKEGPGLSSIVAADNKDLDQNIRKSISDAINAIEGIPGTFSDAVFTNKAAVQNAQTKVRDLLQLLQSELTPYLNSL